PACGWCRPPPHTNLASQTRRVLVARRVQSEVSCPRTPHLMFPPPRDLAPAGRDRPSAVAASFNHPALNGPRGEVVLAVCPYHSAPARVGFLSVNIFPPGADPRCCRREFSH